MLRPDDEMQESCLGADRTITFGNAGQLRSHAEAHAAAVAATCHRLHFRYPAYSSVSDAIHPTPLGSCWLRLVDSLKHSVVRRWPMKKPSVVRCDPDILGCTP